MTVDHWWKMENMMVQNKNETEKFSPEQMAKIRNSRTSQTSKLKIKTTKHLKQSSMWYQYYQNSTTTRKDVIKDVIFQRLIVAFSLLSLEEMQTVVHEYTTRKKQNSSISLHSLLLDRGKLTKEIVDNLRGLRNIEGKSLIPGYDIVRPLGEGGMAAVYLATRHQDGEEVAIKVFAPPVSDVSTEIARFKQECQLAIKLESEYIVKSYEGGDFQGLYYLAMEYVPGVTLAEKVAEEGALGEKRSLEIFGSVLSGMWEAWNRSIVHRDVKPGNIIVREDGATKICDFGLAKALDSDVEITKTGMIMGTPQFMAPEQFTNPGAVDYRIDVYSLGVTLYVMLTGRLPYLGNSYLELSQSHVQEEPIHPSKFDVKVSRPVVAFFV